MSFQSMLLITLGSFEYLWVRISLVPLLCTQIVTFRLLRPHYKLCMFIVVEHLPAVMFVACNVGGEISLSRSGGVLGPRHGSERMEFAVGFSWL